MLGIKVDEPFLDEEKKKNYKSCPKENLSSISTSIKGNVADISQLFVEMCEIYLLNCSRLFSFFFFIAHFSYLSLKNCAHVRNRIILKFILLQTQLLRRGDLVISFFTDVQSTKLRCFFDAIRRKN